ncbi:flavin reductase family protein [Fodinibius sediminis]|uniref:NADH-FMN oxidoreductase RutF, flavin reductase (DIM6/NTAB) family n=1 Tax=Fodinibius sediminis TaxID=1214077 RepID=A0A521AQ91_9BACT|nr:flavin reductase family protein [Fodinibius sediminis]SMO36999.1 NADH-FMN oxidoreductase RutF, flavin reductase (DIM6/NTAB) family [Fodinibius sediminis]
MNVSKQDNAESLKEAMRQLPFPVAIATAAIGKEKRGITIGSFTSLSLSPPLISFNIDHEAQIHPLISRATHYAVHLPQPEQSSLCDHFAISGQTSEEQFEDVDYFRSSYGSPILRAIPTIIQCRSYEKVKAGDHTIMIGEVVEVEQRNSRPSVLYYDRSYRSIGPSVPDKKPKVKRAG